jgi:hypothetical protein
MLTLRRAQLLPTNTPGCPALIDKTRKMGKLTLEYAFDEFSLLRNDFASPIRALGKSLCGNAVVSSICGGALTTTHARVNLYLGRNRRPNRDGPPS